jgi:hypothetical protein
VGRRVGLDDIEKLKSLTLPGIEFRPLSRPVQSLYRLRYRDSHSDEIMTKLNSNLFYNMHTSWNDFPVNQLEVNRVGEEYQLVTYESMT